ncbi:ABC transporter ATP-binding protein [Cupriavidus sp. BIC8F]|uniref:ABC transporter ATP-binding protein n=1 Tax=Cupriavidus sp. BIC8F TaxID=3079014 RepID=UPI0029168807|nr:ABC transporter ATP-binding protein [Cupriavidus sp. BIC8F]
MEFVRVSKAFRTSRQTKVILDDVSFFIPQGRNLAILGRNGAGKSTLIRLIAGAEKPDRGAIRRSGAISFPMALSSFFISSLSARQNVIFVSRVYGYESREVMAYVEAFCEIGSYFDMPIKTFSSGMRARLAFGLSLAFRFDTYLIDEVTAVGDAAFRQKAQNELNKRIRDANIILVSHNNDVLRDSCDCGLVLNNGTVTLHDDIESAIQAYNDIIQKNGHE